MEQWWLHYQKVKREADVIKKNEKVPMIILHKREISLNCTLQKDTVL